MDKITYLLKYIYRLWGMAGRLVDAQGGLLAVLTAGFENYDPVFTSAGLLRELLRWGRKTGGRYGAFQDDGYWYYVFQGPESYVIWGPVVFEEHSEHEKRMYLKRHGVEEKNIQIPLMHIWHFKEIVAFAHGLLFEEYDRTAVFDDGTEPEEFKREFYPKILEYGLERAEYGMEHHSFMDEKRFYGWLMEGETGTKEGPGTEKGTLSTLEGMIGAAGMMAQSQKKDAEYGAVASITLATRYAIAAGAQESEAYALSDVTLQRLAGLESVVEIYDTMRRALREFGSLARGAKKKSKSCSSYVEQSRDYIAEHIYEKLTLQEIAEKIGVHKGYLSRIFSRQMGMTLTDYIMREKVYISCNLLKYSDRSIAMIGEYVNLSPQSYFTRVFRNVMGETPAQYRRMHRDKNFIES